MYKNVQKCAVCGQTNRQMITKRYDTGAIRMICIPCHSEEQRDSDREYWILMKDVNEMTTDEIEEELTQTLFCGKKNRCRVHALVEILCNQGDIDVIWRLIEEETKKNL
jgi:hypothetical protein